MMGGGNGLERAGKQKSKKCDSDFGMGSLESIPEKNADP